MRILKKAEQKNFVINGAFYLPHQLAEFVDEGIAEFLYGEYRLFTSYCKEIKVVLNGGFYETVAVTNTDKVIFVQL